MITRAKWTSTLVALGKEMRSKKTKYNWKSPVNEANTIKQSTCVGYVNLALQRCGLLPEGKYVHLSNGKLAGTGLAYIKAHPEIYEIKWVRATPQKLGSALQIGDICLYTVPHIMVFATRNKAGTPLWYSLERSSKGIGYPAKLTIAGTFSFYTNRKIECIIRIKYANATQTPAKAPTKYKTKEAMNLRKEASAKSEIMGRIPKGAVVTVIRSISGSTWKQIRYCGEVGYMNCASQYVSKV